MTKHTITYDQFMPDLSICDTLASSQGPNKDKKLYVVVNLDKRSITYTVRNFLDVVYEGEFLGEAIDKYNELP